MTLPFEEKYFLKLGIKLAILVWVVLFLFLKNEFRHWKLARGSGELWKGALWLSVTKEGSSWELLLKDSWELENLRKQLLYLSTYFSSLVFLSFMCQAPCKIVRVQR